MVLNYCIAFLLVKGDYQASYLFNFALLVDNEDYFMIIKVNTFPFKFFIFNFKFKYFFVIFKNTNSLKFLNILIIIINNYN